MDLALFRWYKISLKLRFYAKNIESKKKSRSRKRKRNLDVRKTCLTIRKTARSEGKVPSKEKVG